MRGRFRLAEVFERILLGFVVSYGSVEGEKKRDREKERERGREIGKDG